MKSAAVHHPPKDTRERILAAATELLWTQNYGDASTDDICTRAGVNKGSLYHYFPSKCELTVAVLEHLWSQLEPELDRLFSVQQAPLDRVRAYLTKLEQGQRCAFESHGRVCGCPYTNVGSERAPLDEKIREKSLEIVQRKCRYLAAAFRDAMTEGSIPEGNPAALARQVDSYIMGVITAARIANSLAPLEDLRPGIGRLLGCRSF